MRVVGIYRYPVKGLSAESLERVTLTPGECLPHDRRFAIARPDTQFDPSRPEWLPKTKFFMLMRDAVLAQLQTRFDAPSGMFTIARDGEQLLAANITNPDGRRAIEAFFVEFLNEPLPHAPKVVEALGHTFSDAKQKPNSSTYKYVSIVNLASVRALEQVLGATIDPIRFRANLYIDGVPAWTEFDWVDSEMKIGGARVRVVSRTTRCAATTVNPSTAKRDLEIPIALQRQFGHHCMGVYAQVIDGGDVAIGSAVSTANA